MNNEDKNKEDNIIPNYNNQVQYFINTSYDNNEGNNRINKKVYDYNLYYPIDNKTNGKNYNNSDNKDYDNNKYNVVINDNNNIVNDNKNNLYENITYVKKIINNPNDKFNNLEEYHIINNDQININNQNYNNEIKITNNEINLDYSNII